MSDVNAIMGNLKKIRDLKKHFDSNDPVIEDKGIFLRPAAKNRSVGIPLYIELKQLLEKHGTSVKICPICDRRIIVDNKDVCKCCPECGQEMLDALQLLQGKE